MADKPAKTTPKQDTQFVPQHKRMAQTGSANGMSTSKDRKTGA